MIAPCPTDLSGATAMVRLTGFLECQSHVLAKAPFSDAAAASHLSEWVTVGVTLFVARLGYRVLLGWMSDPRELLISAARLGLVLALTSNWGAYQVMVYRVAMDGPAEIANQLLKSGGPPDETSSQMATRVEDLLDRILSVSSPGQGVAARIAPAPAPPSSTATAAPTPAPQRQTSGPAQGGNGLGELLFVLSCLGALAASRLAIGLLLGVGPLFLVAGLFDATLGLLEGWARALIGGAMSAAALMVNVSLQLAFLEGELARSQGDATAAARLMDSVILSSAVFSISSIFLLALCLRLAAGFKWPRGRSPDEGGSGGRIFSRTASSAPVFSAAAFAAAPPSRAGRISQSLATQMRRETEAGVSTPVAVASAPAPDFRSRLMARGTSPSPPFGAETTQRRPLASRSTPETTRRDERR